MTKIKAFLLGIWEFRQDMTTHFDYPLIESYDAGRELAHILTFRYFDEPVSTGGFLLWGHEK
jgi:hypothetical protein